MKVIQEDLWFCEDCTVIAVTGDDSSLDYHYDEPQATRRAARIHRELDAFGPGLVPDYDLENEWYDCSDCRHRFKEEDAETASNEDDESVFVCPDCGSEDIDERDSGYEEFSHRDCDCCGTSLAGSRHRFAVLGEEDAA